MSPAFVADYEESIRIAVAVLETEDALRKTVRLPFGEFPGTTLNDLAAMEQFIHGWIWHEPSTNPPIWIQGWRPSCLVTPDW